MKEWFAALASEFVEGLADGFLVVTGGETAARALGYAPPPVTPSQLLVSMLLAGLYWSACYVKKNKPPFAQLIARPASTSNTESK